MLSMSTWVTPNGSTNATKPAPACTRARGFRPALNNGLDVERPPRTTPTLASRDAWTVGRGAQSRRPRG
jgi:hypothetical protein